MQGIHITGRVPTTVCLAVAITVAKAVMMESGYNIGSDVVLKVVGVVLEDVAEEGSATEWHSNSSTVPNSCH